MFLVNVYQPCTTNRDISPSPQTEKFQLWDVSSFPHKRNIFMKYYGQDFGFSKTLTLVFFNNILVV